jgi:DNA ligase-1
MREESEEGEESETEVANTLEDGDSVEVQGSSSTYTLSRQGTVYMCSCPAWKNQSAPVDGRTCKHLRAYLGEEVESKRLGGVLPASRAASTSGGARSAANKKETAPPVLLAHKWEIEHDPTGWWMSEKLDGVRAYWDGEVFLSRLGNRFFAPDWFVEDLPADTLDGELWVGRKMFSKTMSIVRSGAAGIEWKNVSYVVFDAPNAKGGFEDRIAHAEKVLKKSGAPHARPLEHVSCTGFDHLREELARVEALGGEGLMLRRPKSKYEIGRSQSLLKVKTFHDSEARVIGHAPGTGKHKGRLGALVCELPTGVTFNVGTGFSDAERQAPPKIGAVITFRYQELTDDGVPRFPSWVGERIDVELPAPKKSAIAKGSVATPAEPKAAKAKPARPKPAPAPEPEPAPEATDGGDDDPLTERYGAVDFRVKLVNTDENKFWEIEVRGKQHLTRFGKIGSTGQVRLTEIGSATACRSDAEKRAMQKRREGYR